MNWQISKLIEDCLLQTKRNMISIAVISSSPVYIKSILKSQPTYYIIIICIHIAVVVACVSTVCSILWALWM